MELNELLDNLEYSASPFFLSDSQLYAHTSHSHIFRKAKNKFNLKGVYCLSGKDHEQPIGKSLIPALYVCEAATEEKAREIHRLVWNQNVVPFILVSSPRYFRMYPGFKFDTKLGIDKDQNILPVLKTAKDVLKKFQDFKAQSINDGSVWKKWGDQISPNGRVDTKLLKSLKTLGEKLHKAGLQRSTAHALIGKYVYLHYLRDRKILSDRKLKKWKINKESIFGRNATLDGFFAVVDELDKWLNGTVFPVPRTGNSVPMTKHIQEIASAFLGDDPSTGQMHLDFKAYNFEHIPIETLSMVYQQFLHAEQEGRSKGAYYTPIHLVNFVLDELESKKPLKKGMKVLDPACGSGAFLVQAYRKLIERELSKTSLNYIKPPTLKNLLTDHIFGLDVDEDACKISELSLILTLLDYVDPPDLEKACHKQFKLPILRDKNIFCCYKGFFDSGQKWSEAIPITGFDWIVGNPPWKGLNKDKANLSDLAALKWIDENKIQFPTSKNQIAEAFAWEATRYVSLKGAIGLVMPALTLFKNQNNFRREFFFEMDVWCVVNLSNLRSILFSKAVGPAAVFFYSPKKKPANSTRNPIVTYSPFAANQMVRWEAGKKLWTIMVNVHEIKEISWADAVTGSHQPWKISMWGSYRDRRFLASLENTFPLLEAFKTSHGLNIHEGPQLRTSSSENDSSVIPHPEIANESLIMMKELKKHLKSVDRIFSFPERALEPVGKEMAYIRKEGGEAPLTVCSPPHVIVDASRRFFVFSNDFLVLPPRSTIGIAGKKEKYGLLKALAVYLNSDFARYHQFLTSTYWGVERDRPDQSDLLRLPIPIDLLSPHEIDEWGKLYDDLIIANESTTRKKQLLKRLNEAVNRLLQISKTEKWLIEDLLESRMEFMEGKIPPNLMKPADEDQILEYGNVLKDELDDFLDHTPKDQHIIKIFYTSQMAVIKIIHPEIPKSVSVKAVPIDDPETEKELQQLQALLKKKRGQWLYFNQNLKIYKGRTTYFLKPRQRICWLKSQALLDADEFIAEKVAYIGDTS